MTINTKPHTITDIQDTLIRYLLEKVEFRKLNSLFKNSHKKNIIVLCCRLNRSPSFRNIKQKRTYFFVPFGGSNFKRMHRFERLSLLSSRKPYFKKQLTNLIDAHGFVKSHAKVQTISCSCDSMTQKNNAF